MKLVQELDTLSRLVSGPDSFGVVTCLSSFFLGGGVSVVVVETDSGETVHAGDTHILMY